MHAYSQAFMDETEMTDTQLDDVLDRLHSRVRNNHDLRDLMHEMDANWTGGCVGAVCVLWVERVMYIWSTLQSAFNPRRCTSEHAGGRARAHTHMHTLPHSSWTCNRSTRC